jgi:putative membrane protein
MLSNIILPWLHYLAILMMAGAAVAELYLLKLKPSDEVVRTLSRVDLVYGITAGAVLVTGLLRVYHGGKGADYYWHNGAFHGVLGLFILAALISLVPTVRFMRWKKALETGALPSETDIRKTRPLVHVQLTLVAVIALLITLVARGYGAAA